MQFGVPELEDLGDPSGKSVLVRCDFNVPIRDGQIVDDLRIRASLPTLQWLIDRGATVTACTHLGRPKGQVMPEYSVEPVRRRLAELAPGVNLLENLRYNAGEEANDPAFVAELVNGYDMYVNDAFGASHRAHASIVGPPQTLPSAAGRLLAKEVEVILGMREHPNRPFVAIVGGAKVSDKLGVLRSLLDVADSIIVGGGMCFTFFAALGHSIGNSLCEPDLVDECRKLLAANLNRIFLPEDVVGLGPGGKIGDPSAGGEVRNFGRDVPDGWMGLDIGPGSAALFGDLIGQASTILWNGPMGVFEDPRFAAGTESVAHAVADARGFSVIGGGDSAAAIAQFGLADQVGHMSTGGGASLELIEQGDLPGLDALRSAPNAN